MVKSYIKGLGAYVPPKVITNDELAKLMDTSDEWIRERTGIEERHYAEPGVKCSDLAVEATKRAVQDAGIEMSDIDFILFATLSPDRHFPGTSCTLQSKLGLPGIAAMDIRNQCSGFVYGLGVADSLVKTGKYKNILVVGSEVHSSALDYSTTGRQVTVLFGDAAGAAIVSPAAPGIESGIIDYQLHADGNFVEHLRLDIWDMGRKPYMDHSTVDAGWHWPQMNGRMVFKEATTKMKECILETLQVNNCKIEDLNLLVPHQANLRINQWVAGELKIPESKVVNNIQKYGNTTAASIPLALAEAREQGRLKQNDLVMLVAFGAGFTWGSVLLRW